jgi:UDP-glucose 4-epimerase
MLRYQPTIGPGQDTQVSRYLSLPVVPTYLGFDPRLQFVHERDALEAFIAAVRNPVRGAVNVAAPGTIGLTRMIRRAGKLSLPVAAPLFPTFTTAGRRLGLLDFSPDFRRLLRYGRAVDTGRLATEVGYQPQFDAVSAIEDYVSTFGGRRVVPPLRGAVAR